MSEVLSATNLKFLAQGMWTTLYLSFFIIVLSTLFGTILAVMRNGKNPILRWIASIYVEFVRNVPNLLWIFIIFLVFQLKSTAAGITLFSRSSPQLPWRKSFVEDLTLSTMDKRKPACLKDFNNRQIFIYIIFPQAIRKMLPSIISQFVTVVKDTSFLYSVIALQELFGKSQILMGGYYEPSQIFTLYGILALAYFVVNFAISSYSRYLSKHWEQASE